MNIQFENRTFKDDFLNNKTRAIYRQTY